MYPQKAWEICMPVGDKKIILYPTDDWFDCKNIGKLRLNIFSDVEVEVNIIWSFNKRRKCLVTSNLANNQFESIIVECLMRFFKIQIVNNSGETQRDLVVDIRLIGDTTKHVMFNEGLSSIVVNSIRSKSKSKSRGTIIQTENTKGTVVKSPKKRKSILVETPADDKNNGNDKKQYRKFYTLKESIKPPERNPDECLLIGGEGNTIRVLPNGKPGDILRSGQNGVPEWITMPEISDKIEDNVPLKNKEEEKDIEEISTIPEPWII
jgi:hypothetical protein